MNIQGEIDLTHRFLRKAEQFIEKVNESWNCEICYSHRKTANYTCSHKVCKTCFEKTKQCPFCRAPKPIILHDYFFKKDGLLGQWVRATDDIRKNGIYTEFETDYSRAIFQVICLYNDIKSEIMSCQKYKDFLNNVMPKILVVNAALNYPLFTLHAEKEIFSVDFRLISVIGENLDFRMDRTVLNDLVRKLNRMGFHCLTLIEILMEINDFLKMGAELPNL